MIVINLNGGLGNQMFQYAAGRALASQLDTQLKLDISSFEHCDLRRYELEELCISASIATPEEIIKIKYDNELFFSKILRKLRRKPAPLSWRVYQEPHFHFDPGFDKLHDESYLKGYYQSEKYFSGISEIIRQEFQHRSPLRREVKTIAEKINSCNAVSIHFRLGDYATNPRTNSFHGICSMEYYQEAIEWISRKSALPTFFFFSDDIEWVKNHFPIKQPIFVVEHNGSDKAYVDLRLMSMCKHNIIANSSFSWWGAWLNSNPQKNVVAPRKWFNVSGLNNEDRIPASWKKI